MSDELLDHQVVLIALTHECFDSQVCESNLPVKREIAASGIELKISKLVYKTISNKMSLSSS